MPFQNSNSFHHQQLRGSSPHFHGGFSYNSEYDDSRNSFNNTFSNSFDIPKLGNSLNILSLKNPNKKNYSSGNLSNNKNPFRSGKSNKRSLFLTDKKANTLEEANSIKGEDGNLQSFLDNLQFELHIFICSQKGSRIMQKFLNKISFDNMDLIISRLNHNFPKIMVDLYGNYFCQKLLQACSAEQRIIILNYVRNLQIFNFLIRFQER
jgi:hypothetical protein